MIDATQAALERALDMATRKHAVHTSNIANANVPGYKAKKIDFSDRLEDALSGLENRDQTLLSKNIETTQSLAQLEPDVYEDPLARMKGDGNTVNIDREQGELAKNTIQFQGAVQLLNKKLAMQKYVLSEGGR